MLLLKPSAYMTEKKSRDGEKEVSLFLSDRPASSGKNNLFRRDFVIYFKDNIVLCFGDAYGATS